MKILSLAIAFMMASAHAEEAPILPGTGCIWNDSSGSCLVANNEDFSITCKVRTQITTKNNQKTTKKEVELDPKTTWHSIKFIPAWDDKITEAKIAASCKPTK